MVSRAFGTLPKPKGNNLRLSDKNVKFTDVPKSGKAAVRNLIRGGILVNTKSGKLRPKTLMSEQELKTLVRRIYTLYGTNLKDDFTPVSIKTLSIIRRYRREKQKAAVRRI